MPRRRELVSVVALGAVLLTLAAHAPAADRAGEKAAEKAAKRIRAFPGAEGFGAYAAGGRRGRIIEVANLKIKGPGSLQAACSAKGPRIVVFRVSGQIQGTVRVAEPFITIAGQTAPGDGICIRNGMLQVETHDVIIRHLRVRPGDHPFGPGLERDCIAVSGARARNVIIDHCSASWGTDENMTASSGPHNVTYQWCITSEALHDSIHPKGPHSMGMLLGSVNNNLSIQIHHCLMAHNGQRNPLLAGPLNLRIKSPSIYDVRNNVIYHHFPWGRTQIFGYTHLNYVGNFLKSPNPCEHAILVFRKTRPKRIYVRDNIVWGGKHKAEMDKWQIVRGPDWKRAPDSWRAREPIPVPPVTTEPAAQAYENVLRFAGCTRPVRDVVDARIVAEVRAGAGRIIDSQEDVGGWPIYASATPPADTDHDAIPDAWEKRFGFNPNDPSDGPKDQDGDGYTNVEEFLNLTDPTKPDSGAPIPQPPVKIQAGNDRIRGEAGRKRGEERLARLNKPDATPESADALVRKVRESGKEVGDLLGIRFVKIPPGEIVLGKVKVTHTKPYELSACEITQAQWETVMGTRPWSGQAAANGNPQFPATYVNYLDCREFVRRLNACGVRKYRLPTACEWLYAARSGTDSVWGFGKDKKRVQEYAWCMLFYSNKDGSFFRRYPTSPQAVGKLKPNPWGLYDMAGNTREWVHDWYWYQPKQSGVTDPMGPKSGSFRMTCGGHFRYYPSQILHNTRAKHRPHYRGFEMGFRLQRALQ